MKKIAIAGIATLGTALLAGLWLRAHLQVRDADAELQRQPVYQVLKKHEPDSYQRVRGKLAQSARGTAGRQEFINYANAQLAEAATRRLANASDPAVLKLMNDMLITARALQRKPGDACFRFLFPQVSGPPDIASHVDAVAQARTLDAMAEVIRSAAEQPVALPENALVQDKLAVVVNGIYEQFGADAQMIANAEDPRVDRAKVCAMTISLYERILAWPPGDSAAIIRAMTQVSGTG
jgi:hypothetical protein